MRGPHGHQRGPLVGGSSPGALMVISAGPWWVGHHQGPSQSSARAPGGWGITRGPHHQGPSSPGALIISEGPRWVGYHPGPLITRGPHHQGPSSSARAPGGWLITRGPHSHHQGPLANDPEGPWWVGHHQGPSQSSARAPGGWGITRGPHHQGPSSPGALIISEGPRWVGYHQGPSSPGALITNGPHGHQRGPPWRTRPLGVETEAYAYTEAQAKQEGDDAVARIHASLGVLPGLSSFRRPRGYLVYRLLSWLPDGEDREAFRCDLLFRVGTHTLEE
ncbi:hypothetical protein NHX12_020017 [Muraenolepis orangiensis]|uniref:Uncharacterized protein n=1 Tax=Muraenolepis orangiensis TaxID=630683 RepID=A0A9Q0EXU7_9TELE|nr:hypothetical protein NHX12_020017 [Muraenolepis orangiensis]